MGKQNLYQHTWRVPFIVKGPGIKAGSRVEGNIYLLDVLSTLCDLADVKAPETSEGLSFKPVLQGQKQFMRDVVYGAYSGGGKPGMRTVKQGDWKLIRYESTERGVNETQLFNLAENPDELLPEHGKPNLAKNPKHSEKLKEMQALLLSEMRRLEDPYRFSDQPGDDLPLPPGKAKKPNNKKKK
jgi:arylsulfatase A-like enzyme